MAYRRQRLNIDRTRLRKGRPRSHTRNYKSPDKEDYHFMGKVLITSILFLVILVIKAIDRPLPQKMVHSIRVAITQDFDMRESVGKLKFVQRYSPKIKSVFNIDEGLLGEDKSLVKRPSLLVMPAEGKIVGDFNDTEGLSIQGDEKLEVLSAADGEVVLIDEHDAGHVITIRHSQDLVTVYHNITRPYVMKADEVKQGDMIGVIEGSVDKEPLLHFKVWNNKKPIDPKSLLQ